MLVGKKGDLVQLKYADGHLTRWIVTAIQVVGQALVMELLPDPENDETTAASSE